MHECVALEELYHQITKAPKGLELSEKLARARSAARWAASLQYRRRTGVARSAIQMQRRRGAENKDQPQRGESAQSYEEESFRFAL
jgi:hypothetical protein